MRTGCKMGKGKEILPNGNEYNGEFLNDLYNGHDELKYNNGDIYGGEFKCNRKYGKWSYINKKKGTRFEGEWVNDLKYGKGTIYYKDGSKLEGNWKNGIKNGEFRFYKNKDSNDYTVKIYENGVQKENN